MDTKENRAHPRFDEKDVIRIAIATAPEDTDLSGRGFFTLSHDLSVGGLSFSAHVAPAVGTTLKLTVAFSSPPRSVKDLVGRVAWVQKVPNGARYIVGVDLSESPGPSLAEWKSVITRRIVTNRP